MSTATASISSVVPIHAEIPGRARLRVYDRTGDAITLDEVERITI